MKLTKQDFKIEGTDDCVSGYALYQKKSFFGLFNYWKRIGTETYIGGAIDKRDQLIKANND